jgi:excisionase family DNA binding protein
MSRGRKARRVPDSLLTCDSAYLTPSQIAGYFGLHIYTVQRWCQHGKIAALKVGNDWRIPIETAREIESRLFQPRKTA